MVLATKHSTDDVAVDNHTKKLSTENKTWRQ